MSLLLGAADTLGGAWGARRGPQAIRRLLDTWRTGPLALVLAVALLVAGLSSWLSLALIRLLPGSDSDATAADLFLAAVFGLLAIAGTRMVVDVLLRLWWRGRRSFRPVLVPAPSGVPATAYLRSRVGLVVPALVAVLFTAFGAGFALLTTSYASVWWALPFVAWGAWGAACLAPIVLGRARAGGLYLTIHGLEAQFGTVTAFVPWLVARVPEGDRLLLPAGRGSRRRSFPWNVAGDPTDWAPRNWVSVPVTYLPVDRAQITLDLATYVDNPLPREHLGTPRSLEWVRAADD